ncbi:DUF4326 domain-containing protein [Sinorhizobium medicae]|nr:DUF4326 domain-containing protein [Sinorhizobium medicae]MDX0575836.1 DUF4326 domain-containing protein [Sinorhizobium medicae]MDX0779623.1 DUF4326 domain-containing protein [Sinorhizobium medicae]MDX1099613.1 DUF4326 domain-containing protein [Sinorhizobium medicae]
MPNLLPFRIHFEDPEIAPLDPDIAALERTRRFVAENVDELRGKNLACWCRPSVPCHADVLIAVANRDGVGR